MSAKKSDVDVWAHFGEGGALSVDVVSRSEAEELSAKVAQLEDEVRYGMAREYTNRRDTTRVSQISMATRW